MRLLTTLDNADNARKISSYLTVQGIENTLDLEATTDWGSSDYGIKTFKLWIIDEDQFEPASQILRVFNEDPYNSIYNSIIIPTLPEKKTSIKPKIKTEHTLITKYLIALCAFIYTWSALTTPEFKSIETNQVYSPLYTSPVKQKFLFGFPKAYEILDKLVVKFGIDALQDTNKLNAEGKSLALAYQNAPYWQGLYQEALYFFSTGHPAPNVPWFEKISQGELWRFVSPIFLHGDIFHILFNMAWLYILGKQLEIQLRAFRYLIFVLIAAIFSNTAQYIISGPNFIGFSGVICAMLSFIWMRQKIAPWEGFQLQKSTFKFMMIFIFGMLALQTISFAAELLTGKMISTSIANGAHIFGLMIGWVFAKTPFFTQRKSS